MRERGGVVYLVSHESILVSDEARGQEANVTKSGKVTGPWDSATGSIFGRLNAFVILLVTAGDGGVTWWKRLMPSDAGCETRGLDPLCSWRSVIAEMENCPHLELFALTSVNCILFDWENVPWLPRATFRDPSTKL